MTRVDPKLIGGAEVSAFLDMIAVSEIGHALLAHSDDGYNVLVGGGTFSGYNSHPNKLIPLPKLGVSSTAAGRYQLLNRWWLPYCKTVGISPPDFTPETQDRIAAQQLKERKVPLRLAAGDFLGAVHAASAIWASLPGNSYGQHVNSLQLLHDAYAQAGGTLPFPETDETPEKHDEPSV